MPRRGKETDQRQLLTVADSYRTIALFRLGKKDEAKALLAEVVATMRPVPDRV